jgi:hypothetical protein
MGKKRKISREEVNIIIEKYNIDIGKYTINEQGTIDVDGDVVIRYANLRRLPLRFGIVQGNFNCSGLKLFSLIGAPSYIFRSFICKENNLTSLKHGPKYVGTNYDCSENNLETLDGCAKEVGGNLLCNNNNLVNLKGSPALIQGYFNCKNNKLKTLTGSPQELNGRFHLSHNLLNNFEGSPKKIWGEIYATSNFLINLKGLSPDFDGRLFLDASTKSINTGQVDYKNMSVELRRESKFGHNFMPSLILTNNCHVDLIVKFQRHYEVWTKDDELDQANFQILMEDIEDGLR